MEATEQAARVFITGDVTYDCDGLTVKLARAFDSLGEFETAMERFAAGVSVIENGELPIDNPDDDNPDDQHVHITASGIAALHMDILNSMKDVDAMSGIHHPGPEFQAAPDRSDADKAAVDVAREIVASLDGADEPAPQITDEP